MGIDKIMKIAVTIVMGAAATGHLQDLTLAIQKAQFKILHESRASNWGSPDLLYSRRNK